MPLGVITMLILPFLFFSLFSNFKDAYAGMTDSIVWEFNNLEEIGGNKTTVIGNPIVIETPEGYAVEFDGVDDAIILDVNPLAGASEFTIEVIFCTYAGGLEAQRFLHMQETNDHRVLIETRLTSDNKWFLDTFIRSGQSSKTLYAQDFLHPIDEWNHAALVYEQQEMRHYVNGVEELTGAINYIPVKGGQTSIGARLNMVSWFKGAIRILKITHYALSPEEFLL